VTTLSLIQGSREWHMARLGKVTASRASDVIAKTKTGWSASRGRYMVDLIGERLTGIAAPCFVTQAMQWGIEQEPYAKSAYEFLTDTTIEPAGFVEHPTIPMSGASPDGLVGTDGLVEIKCPGTAAHIETLLKRAVPADYLPQVNWQFACTGRKWCDFISFDPRFPEHLRLVVIRVDRDQQQVEQLEAGVTAFQGELAAMLEALQTTADRQPELVA
jgi:putative phage-type endonuclease